MEDGRVLSIESMNRRLFEMQYAVRGELVILADKLKHELSQGKKFAFDEVVMCNVGNPQSLGQHPITFFRQVLALCEYPSLMESPLVSQLFPEDVIIRAKQLLAYAQGGGVGAYSNSKGLEGVRQEIAEFIAKRDGFPSQPENIFLGSGASETIAMILTSLIRGPQDGVMIPIPQYPLYSATIKLLGGTQVGYFLDEETQWSLNVDELKRSLNEARASGLEVRAIVIINPGNPTGACMKEDNIREVIQFAKKERLVLLADEVYQTNIYRPTTKFVSFKKVLRSLGSEYEAVELASFHSVSKGFVGECGHRGGYVEIVGFDQAIVGQLYKLSSARLCSNITGQILLALMVNPPKPGDFSFELYQKEIESTKASLTRRSILLTEELNKLEGVSLQTPEGAMYAFPRITLPAKAVETAKNMNVAPDHLYCLSLLESTGICVIPGSGFGQKDGTYHFRTTFLPPEEQMKKAIAKMKTHHETFLKKYS